MPRQGEELDTDAAVVLVSPNGTPPDWAVEAVEAVSARVTSPAAGDAALEEALSSAGAVVLDAAVDAPLTLARRMRRLAPQVQVVLVVAPERRDELHRAMLFTPGLGEPWLVGPAELDGELLRDAARLGGRRRTHARRQNRISERVAGLERAPSRWPFLSDAYLATLLELLPHPVLALDQQGRVLFANPAAESLVEPVRSRQGDGLVSLLDPEDPGTLERLLDRGRDDVRRAQMRLRPGGAARVYDVSVAPVRSERRLRAVVLHDVTEELDARKLVERQAEQLEAQADELRRRNEELEEAIRHRTRFYQSLSHEIRTPINAIVGYNDLLLGELFGEVPEEQREILDRIRVATDHLTALVGDVLDLSKMEVGKLELSPERVELRPLLGDIEALMQPLARSHDVVLRFSVEPACSRSFRTDPRRLREILVNLISNAIQYGAGAPVDVRAGCPESRLEVEIQDRGPGIPPGRIEEIFDEFVQLEPDDDGGTGLGLPIARSLARMFGGDVEVSSEQGSGSVFTVRVPELAPEAAE